MAFGYSHFFLYSGIYTNAHTFGQTLMTSSTLFLPKATTLDYHSLAQSLSQPGVAENLMQWSWDPLVPHIEALCIYCPH